MTGKDCCEGDDDPDLQKIFTTVSVTDPIIHYTCDKRRFTTYQITLESNDSCFSCTKSVVRRSFSEFLILRRLLKQLNPNLHPPVLPSSSFFRDQFNEEFIEQRREKLELFMRKVLDEFLYLSNKALHLFLQSHLSMKNIEALVTGCDLCVPPDYEESSVFSDSSTWDTSSEISESQSCDSLDGYSSQDIVNKSVSLLSINHEAFVTSVPYLNYSADIYVNKVHRCKS